MICSMVWVSTGQKYGIECPGRKDSAPAMYSEDPCFKPRSGDRLRMLEAVPTLSKKLPE
jgi:hypothetical protein